MVHQVSWLGESPPRYQALLISVQRLMALLIVWDCCTISSATVLARSPSFDILADMEATVYDQVRSVARNGDDAATDHEPGML